MEVENGGFYLDGKGREKEGRVIIINGEMKSKGLKKIIKAIDSEDPNLRDLCKSMTSDYATSTCLFSRQYQNLTFIITYLFSLLN